MNRAFRVLMQQGDAAKRKIIALHKGRYQASGISELSLGPGPFVAALEYACDATSVVVGKPNPLFFLAAIQHLGVQPSECVMIGDDVRDDVFGAQAVGAQGWLVRTGKYQPGDESRYANSDIPMEPDKVVDNFSMAVTQILRNLAY
jgi:HAD superfamily hydrolase (TIGR01458 family)